MTYKLKYIFFIIICFNISCFANKAVITHMYGNWIIKKAIPGNITAITLEEANNLIGKEIIIHPDYLMIFNDKCINPSFDYSQEVATDYLYDNYQINENLLDIKSKLIDVIETKCTFESGENYYDFILTNSKRLIFIYEGFFFMLEQKVIESKDDKSM